MALRYARHNHRFLIVVALLYYSWIAAEKGGLGMSSGRFHPSFWRGEKWPSRRAMGAPEPLAALLSLWLQNSYRRDDRSIKSIAVRSVEMFRLYLDLLAVLLVASSHHMCQNRSALLECQNRYCQVIYYPQFPCVYPFLTFYCSFPFIPFIQLII